MAGGRDVTAGRVASAIGNIHTCPPSALPPCPHRHTPLRSVARGSLWQLIATGRQRQGDIGAALEEGRTIVAQVAQAAREGATYLREQFERLREALSRRENELIAALERVRQIKGRRAAARVAAMPMERGYGVEIE